MAARKLNNSLESTRGVSVCSEPLLDINRQDSNCERCRQAGLEC